MDESDRAYHPIANLFPLLQGEEFEQLKASILENGLLEPIVLLEDGAILDGRNRHRACIETDTRPTFEQYQGAMDTASLWAYVKAKNWDRRHLESGQRAAIAVEADELVTRLEEEARQRQEATRLKGRTSDNEPLFGGGIIATTEPSKTRDTLADMFDTNARYIQDASKLRRDAPDLLSQVKQGDLTIPQAKRELVKRQRQDAPPLPDDKYRIWYADPPWQYNDSGVINDDNYGRAERHYPTMSISELCAMGDAIKDRSLSDAVLFLWTTSPLLEDAFSVVKAWGFQYKTSFVWDKVRHNFGHYNSVRHEFLLVCTRGSCTPDNLQLFDSVQEIERTDTHSEKPEEFRVIIETLYTTGKRIELFARRDHHGWDTWGNEPNR